jgi:hypothetical protein
MLTLALSCGCAILLFMRPKQVLAEASVREFLDAKVDAALDRTEKWLETGNNADKVLLTAAGGFSMLAAGAEFAANRLDEREGTKGLVQRGALHALTVGSLAGSGVSLFLEGLVVADEEEKQSSSS